MMIVGMEMNKMRKNERRCENNNDYIYIGYYEYSHAVGIFRY